MFNLMGWDLVGNLSSFFYKYLSIHYKLGQYAKTPKRDVPIGILTSVLVLFLSYVLPLWVTASVMPRLHFFLLNFIKILSRSEWNEDIFAVTGRNIWDPLFYFINFAAFFGLFGLGATFMTTSSEAIAYSGEWHYFPESLCVRTSGSNTPYKIVLLQAFAAVALAIPFRFVDLVQVCHFFPPIFISSRFKCGFIHFL